MMSKPEIVRRSDLSSLTTVTVLIKINALPLEAKLPILTMVRYLSRLCRTRSELRLIGSNNLSSALETRLECSAVSALMYLQHSLDFCQLRFRIPTMPFFTQQFGH